MKLIASAAAMVAAASLATSPLMAATDNNYDPVMYDMMLDCAALQILFANNSDKQEDKDDSIKMGAAFLTSAQEMSGSEINDLGPVISPRIEKIKGWINSDADKARRLTKTCAYVLKIGKNYVSG
ncbi:MAG: hypothetical protein IE933_12620 [Sphingomonadales bacterium]|nr:hypothetical protein [Sphingomonadales bacterium]MBD3773197.1 hypothetical protein [Paracoccaceae bacterium]